MKLRRHLPKPVPYKPRPAQAYRIKAHRDYWRNRMFANVLRVMWRGSVEYQNKTGVYKVGPEKDTIMVDIGYCLDRYF